MDAYVQHDINKGIATVEFFHPQSNSLPGNILAQFASTITALGQDDAVKVIILKSGGNRTFCAGASFDELSSIADFDTGKRFFLGFANVINAMRTCPKFIIGRVQGKAVGGGIGVASATDYCMATKFAAIRLSELMIGIGPFVVGPAVERKVGKSAFVQLSMTPHIWHSAEWSRDKGLYTNVYETVEELDEAVQALAEKLATYNPEAMQLLKKAFWEGCEHWDQLLDERAAMSGQLVLSEFTTNAIASFKSK